MLPWWSVVFHSHIQGSVGCVCVCVCVCVYVCVCMWKLFWGVLRGSHLLWDWFWLWQDKPSPQQNSSQARKNSQNQPFFSTLGTDGKHAATWEGFIREHSWTLGKNGVALWHHPQVLLLLPSSVPGSSSRAGRTAVMPTSLPVPGDRCSRDCQLQL